MWAPHLELLSLQKYSHYIFLFYWTYLASSIQLYHRNCIVAGANIIITGLLSRSLVSKCNPISMRVLRTWLGSVDKYLVYKWRWKDIKITWSQEYTTLGSHLHWDSDNFIKCRVNDLVKEYIKFISHHAAVWIYNVTRDLLMH